MAKTVSTAIMVSYALSMTILPTLLAILDEKLDFVGVATRRSWLLSGWSHPKLTAAYARLLRFVITSRLRRWAFSLILPITGFVLASTLESQFFPRAKRDMFEILVQASPAYDQPGLAEITREIDGVLQEKEWITQRLWFSGGASAQVYYNSIASRTDNPTVAYGVVNSISPDHVIDHLADLQIELRDAFPGVVVRVQPFANGPPIDSPISYNIIGSNLDTMRKFGERVQTILSNSEGVVYSEASLGGAAPKLQLQFDRTVASQIGLNENALIEARRIRLEGVIAGTMSDGVRDIPIRVRGADSERNSLDHLLHSPLILPDGNAVPVSSVAELQLVPSPSGLLRVNGRRVNRVSGYVMPYKLPSTVQKNVDAAMVEANLQIPHGIELKAVGEAAEADESQATFLATASIFGVLIVTCLVVVLGSFRQAGLIARIAPLCLGLGFFGIWLFDAPLGFVGVVGAVGLMGVAINDSIVVLMALRSNKESASGDLDAIVKVTTGATRHVIATSLTTIGGFTPLLIDADPFWLPLAAAMAGGIAGSVLISLFMVPGWFYFYTQKNPIRVEKNETIRTTGISTQMH